MMPLASLERRPHEPKTNLEYKARKLPYNYRTDSDNMIE